MTRAAPSGDAAALPFAVRWLGRVPYATSHAAMVDALEARVAGAGPDTVLVCEHDPVYTLGRRRGAAAHVVDPGDTPVLQVERGGDVTWHGPGQVVVYPVLGLPRHAQDLHGVMRGLEQVVIDVLAELGVAAGRDARNTGVWIEGQKVAAIGIACRKWVTWHGLALNVTPDLGVYRRILPCGLPQDTVTRLADHVQAPPPKDVADRVVRRLGALWTRILAGEPWPVP